MQFHIHVYYHLDQQIESRLVRIETNIDRILKTLEDKMSALDDKLAQVLATVTATTDKVDSLVAYQAGLKQQLADALAAAGQQLTPEQSAVFDQVFALQKREADAIDTALAANTPPA